MKLILSLNTEKQETEIFKIKSKWLNEIDHSAFLFKHVSLLVWCNNFTFAQKARKTQCHTLIYIHILLKLRRM